MQIEEHIAWRLRQERKRRAWSLDELAARSHVSRAMISKIERQVSTPTAVLLARLADALELTMSSLMFDQRTRAHGVMQLCDQVQWTDPATGYTRRLVSAAAHEDDDEIVAVEFPSGAQVRFAAATSLRIEGRVLLLTGELALSVGNETMHLAPGDCAHLSLHLAHEVRNPGSAAARYLVVIRRFA